MMEIVFSSAHVWLITMSTKLCMEMAQIEQNQLLLCFNAHEFKTTDPHDHQRMPNSHLS